MKTFLIKIRIFADKQIVFVAATCLLLVMLFMNGFFLNSFLSVFIFALSAVLIIAMPFEKRTLFLVFFVFFSSLYKTSWFSFSLFTVLLIVYYSSSAIFAYQQINKNKIPVIMASFLFITLLLTFLVNFSSSNITTLFSVFIYSLFPYFVLFCPLNKQKVLSAFVFGFIVSVLFTIPCFFSNVFINNLYDFFYRTSATPIYISFSAFGQTLSVLRYSALSFDPNFFGFDSAIVFSIVLLNKANRRAYFHIPYFFIAIFVSLFGLLSFSKMFVMFFVIVMLFLLILKIVKLAKDKKIGLLALVLTVVPCLLITVGPYLFSLLFSRVFDELKTYSFIATLNSLSTGRFTLFKFAINTIFSNPLVFMFGQGLNDVGAGLSILSSHNTLIQIMLTRGAIGVFAFLAPFVLMWYQNKRILRFSPSEIVYLVIVACLTCGLPLDGSDKIGLSLACIMFCCMPVCIDVDRPYEIKPKTVDI